MSIKIKIIKLLKDLDLSENSNVFNSLLNNALAAKDCGLTWKEINFMIQEQVEDLPLETWDTEREVI